MTRLKGKLTLVIICVIWMLINCVESQSYNNRRGGNRRYAEQNLATNNRRASTRRQTASASSRYGSNADQNGRFFFDALGLGGGLGSPFGFGSRRRRPYSDPCRSRRRVGRSSNDAQGRFFFDALSGGGAAYDYYGCGGGGGGGGSYSDSYYDRPTYSRPPYRPQNDPYGSLISLFNQNRPQGGGQSSSPIPTPGNPEDIYDPVFEDRPVSESIPGDIPAPEVPVLEPGAIVGSVTTSINGVMQSIGNSQNRPKGIFDRFQNGFSRFLNYLF